MKTYEYGNPTASVVFIQPVDEHDLSFMENEIAEIKKHTEIEFYLIAVGIEDWNKDLSPWRAPAVFGKEDFGDGAKETLDEIKKLCADKEKTYIIGGYSLAALFALWTSYCTDMFTAVAAASPSMWFPGFTDFMENNEILCDSVYLSLGDREEKTKNPVMQTVGACIKKAQELLNEKGVQSTLEWNEGNHFKDADIRTAKAFAWTLNSLTLF